MKYTAILILLCLLGACSDKQKGIETQYYENGQLMRRIEYNGKTLDGYITEYYPDGTLKNKSAWKNGLLEGTFESYYSNAKLKSVSHWASGRPHGMMEEYFENGKLKSKARYKEGQIDTVFFDLSNESDFYEAELPFDQQTDSSEVSVQN